METDPRLIEQDLARVRWRLRNIYETINKKGNSLEKSKSEFKVILQTIEQIKIASYLPEHLQRSFHYIVSRSFSASTKAEIRRSVIELSSVLNEIRRYTQQTRFVRRADEPPTPKLDVDIEARLRGLEQQIAAKSLITETDGQEEITLDTLKGKKVLFGIMPFGIEFDDVWEGGIKRAASSTGFYPLRIDKLTKSSDITDDIIAVIKRSDIVVVDVTKNNPNVMFEFGYALALKKAPVIISQSTDYLPFDIQNIRTIVYQNTWKGIEKLHDELQKFIKGTTKQKTKKSK